MIQTAAKKTTPAKGTKNSGDLEVSPSEIIPADAPPYANAAMASMVEDPIAEFINKNWKNLLILLIACAAFFYGRSQFIETSNARLGEASGFYSRAVEAVTALGQGKATEEQKKALPDLVRALQDAQPPYSTLADTVASLEKTAGGDMAAAEAQISVALPVSDTKDSQHLVRLGAEVSKLAAARLLLIEDTKRAKAIDALVALVNDGEFVPASALTVLQAVAPDRVAQDDLVNKLETRKPYATAVLK